MNKYLVIGIYENFELGSRFAQVYEAPSAEEAEAMAPEGCIVAAVITAPDLSVVEVVA